ncbi:AaceriACR035Wp [[Ashbya] aceris (nom. inval.)]|nr:AaceriACR035Wp [[Ashbya] aceris (nom. inval.)]
MFKTEIYSPEGLRLDGRRWNELRRFECSINTHPTAADGSSYLEQGNNKIITLVKGPQEPALRSQVNPNKATLTVTVNMTKFASAERSKTGHKNERRILEMQTALVRTFEKNVMLQLYPRTAIDVQVHVLQNDGGVLGSMINGITLALIDAGIAMYDYISGISVGLYDTTPLLDLNRLEEQAMSCFTLGVVGKSEKLSLLLVEDKVPLDRLESVMSLGIAGTHRVRDMMDKVLRQHGKIRLDNNVAN